jgi:predicted histidine transporter YuiF (NhaC family)
MAMEIQIVRRAGYGMKIKTPAEVHFGFIPILIPPIVVMGRDESEG